MYYLESIGKKDAYDTLTPREKKRFFLKWFASRNAGVTTTEGIQQVERASTKNKDFKWMGKDTISTVLKVM